ncbi:MAG: DUF2461 domain-containing protein [Bacteroidales bacterium]|nr:DUF2461 domain-containing protein [Bacteroidales bacterium]
MILNTTILEFLKTLSNNNNREWFQENKKWYNEARENFELFVNMMIAEISKFDPLIKTISAKESIYRIYRDTRFSNDKTPYKTNFGAHIVQSGRKSGLAGYYLHIEPGGCFIGGGIYMPEAPVLKAVRNEIYGNTEEFKKILNNSAFKKLFPKIYGDKLKKAPKDFPNDFKDVDLLKFKSYTLLKEYDEASILKKAFFPEIIKAFNLMYAFNQFINRAILESE